ncbi:MAG: pantetheine-phosphate adenylyltransferase [Candidatus Altiarchaeota archaeon]|nr:pantetheine-phosphate adenylyltransferase [Candidatus Altiarchaeota archaeon]
MFRKVVIGGTYDMLHKGHKKILETGFRIAGEVVIGLTSDEFAKRFRAEDVLSYEKRKAVLEEYIKAFGKPYGIIRIDDSYGIATIDPGIDCIMASEETLLRAGEINAIRFKKGLEKLTIVVVPIVLAKDGRPISSDRINRGEIDKEGMIVK